MEKIETLKGSDFIFNNIGNQFAFADGYFFLTSDITIFMFLDFINFLNLLMLFNTP